MSARNLPAGPLNVLLSELSRIAAGQGTDQPPDGLLLERFLGRRDETAFALLVRRHGAMVWGVCRRQLPRMHDAEDAFQATFVLLARKAASIRRQHSVGSWLYGVAYRLARRLRDSETCRRDRERQGGAAMPQPDPMSELTWRELRLALDEELAGLPDRHRVPLVLCYLEGRTQEEAARQLGCSKGSLWRRLERGLGLLRGRLTRRGLTLSGGLFALLLSGNPSPAALPPALLEAAVRSALALAGGRRGAEVVSARVAALAEGSIHSMLPRKVATALFLAAALVLAASGAGVLAYHHRMSATPPETEVADAAPPAATAPSEGEKPGRVARTVGRPLPAGAAMRLGESSLWQDAPFSCLLFSGDGKVLACARLDNTIRLLEVPTGRELRRLGASQPPDPRRRDAVSCMAFAPGGKALAALRPGQGVVIWDVEKGEEIGRLNVDLQHEAAALAFAPDGKTLATGGVAQPVNLWEVATGKELRQLAGHEGRAATVAFAPDGKTLASGGDDQTVRLWDVSTGKEVRRLRGHRNAVLAVAFAPDGKTLASVAADATVRVWDAAAGTELQRIDAARGHPRPGAVRFLAFSPDGKTVALGRSDRTVRSWTVDDGREAARFEETPGEATPIALAPDGRTLALGHVAENVVPLGAAPPGGRIHFWDRLTGKELSPAEGHERGVHAVAFAPDGRTLATGSADRTVRLWETATGREVRRLVGHSGEVTVLAFAPDGRTLASASDNPTDRTISLWDVVTGAEVRQFRLNSLQVPIGKERFVAVQGGVHGLAFAPDGKTLAAVAWDRTVWLWDAAGVKEPRLLKVRGSAAAFSPDGASLAVLETGGSVCLIDLSTDREVHPPIQLAGADYGIGFAPDCKSLLTATQGNQLMRWDVRTGKELRRPVEADEVGNEWHRDGPEGQILPRSPYGKLPAAFSPDGRTIAFYAKDGSVRLVEVATGKERGRFTGHQAAVTSLAFAPDGRTVATGSMDATALLWDVTRPGKTVAPKERLTGDELETLWADLAGDAATAYRAVVALTAAPAQSVPFLRERLAPAPVLDPGRVPKLIADLGSNEFEVRRKAADELDAFGDRAREPLRKALADKPGLDLQKRIQSILDTLDVEKPEKWRGVRAVEVLEHAGTPEARRHLETLGKGAADALLTREARAALERGGKR
jgi:RNA polymerase sigma factor (sigma-70 family)